MTKQLHFHAMFALVLYASTASAEPPAIVKEGTIQCDIVEATPIVWKNQLHFFQAVRPDYKHKQPGVSECYFRFWNAQTESASPAFAIGRHLGCAFTKDDQMWVFGVPTWGAGKIEFFRSDDLASWREGVALKLDGWGIYNTSVCEADGKYIMAFEIDKPADEAGVPFTARFAESKDLEHWQLLPRECAYTRERYSACPSIRFHEGFFYMTYLEARPGPTYETHIVRSRDLVAWEASKRNPVLAFSEEDKRIGSERLNAEERTRIANAKNLNSSDFDFCEFDGRVVILYSWGNQQGIEHLARASFAGSLEEFLQHWFR